MLPAEHQHRRDEVAAPAEAKLVGKSTYGLLESVELSVAVNLDQPATPAAPRGNKLAAAVTADLADLDGRGIRQPGIHAHEYATCVIDNAGDAELDECFHSHTVVGLGWGSVVQEGVWGHAGWLAADWRPTPRVALSPVAGVVLGRVGPTPYESSEDLSWMAGLKWAHTPSDMFYWNAEAVFQPSIEARTDGDAASAASAVRLAGSAGFKLLSGLTVRGGLRADRSQALDDGIGVGGGWNVTPMVNFGWDEPGAW